MWQHKSESTAFSAIIKRNCVDGGTAWVATGNRIARSMCKQQQAHSQLQTRRCLSPRCTIMIAHIAGLLLHPCSIFYQRLTYSKPRC